MAGRSVESKLVSISACTKKERIGQTLPIPGLMKTVIIAVATSLSFALSLASPWLNAQLIACDMSAVANTGTPTVHVSPSGTSTCRSSPMPQVVFFFLIDPVRWKNRITSVPDSRYSVARATLSSIFHVYVDEVAE